MSQHFESIHEAELVKAMDRWQGVLGAITGELTAVIPKEWKEKSLESRDQSFIDNKI